MYTVHGHPRSRALRVIWALEELEQPYEIDPLPPRSEKLREVNGTGKIPVLGTPEGMISDSVAIITYLADAHGGLTYPAGTFARAHQDAVTHYVNAEIDSALWLYAKHSFVLPEDWRVPAVKPTAVQEFSRAMEVLERLKGHRQFMAGDQFTISDILLSHCAGWGLSIKFPLPEGPFGEFLRSLRQRPAMQRTLAQVKAFS
ncbi:MAG: glutathione S-transferase family protein [Pseudomonadota bacterium]